MPFLCHVGTIDLQGTELIQAETNKMFGLSFKLDELNDLHTAFTDNYVQVCARLIPQNLHRGNPLLHWDTFFFNPLRTINALHCSRFLPAPIIDAAIGYGELNHRKREFKWHWCSIVSEMKGLGYVNLAAASREVISQLVSINQTQQMLEPFLLKPSLLKSFIPGQKNALSKKDWQNAVRLEEMLRNLYRTIAELNAKDEMIVAAVQRLDSICHGEGSDWGMNADDDDELVVPGPLVAYINANKREWEAATEPVASFRSASSSVETSRAIFPPSAIDSLPTCSPPAPTMASTGVVWRAISSFLNLNPNASISSDRHHSACDVIDAPVSARIAMIRLCLALEPPAWSGQRPLGNSSIIDHDPSAAAAAPPAADTIHSDNYTSNHHRLILKSYHLLSPVRATEKGWQVWWNDCIEQAKRHQAPEPRGVLRDLIEFGRVMGGEKDTSVGTGVDVHV